MFAISRKQLQINQTLFSLLFDQQIWLAFKKTILLLAFERIKHISCNNESCKKIAWLILCVQSQIVGHCDRNLNSQHVSVLHSLNSCFTCTNNFEYFKALSNGCNAAVHCRNIEFVFPQSYAWKIPMVIAWGMRLVICFENNRWVKRACPLNGPLNLW